MSENIGVFTKTTYTNETSGCRAESSVEELQHDGDIKQLFHSLSVALGACKSKIYVDIGDKKSVAIGWYFEKREKYNDAPKTYIQGAWVSFLKVAETDIPYYCMDGHRAWLMELPLSELKKYLQKEVNANGNADARCNA